MTPEGQAPAATGARLWIAGARPRTLPAAVVPVVVGTAVAFHGASIAWPAAVLALVVSLSLQVGVNFSNDYSDGVRGTDDVRVGPVRLVAGGLAAASSVKSAAFVSFGVGCCAGLALAAYRAPWIIAVGAVCVAAAWSYTGGSHPYGYAGLGEVAVFVFFGVVATVGTTYVVAGRYLGLSLAASVPVGLLAVALLVTNNLRDRDGDARSGKRTLAVRLGDRRTRRLFVACVAISFLDVATLAGGYRDAWILLGLGAVPIAIVPVASVVRGATGRELVSVLGATARVQIVAGTLLAVGLCLGPR